MEYGTTVLYRLNGENIMNFDLMKDLLERFAAEKFPGCSVRVCMHGKELFSYATGYSDIEKRIPMTTDSLIYIYSCSKPATATAALQLYEKGFFLLDDPLYDFIPEFKDVYTENEQGELSKAKNPITLRHLFTMTSGISYATDTAEFEKAKKLTDGKMDTLTVIKCLAERPLSFEPGEKFLYGLSHDVLAAVVEVVSGKKFRDYVKENIFEPLGMTKSTYHGETIAEEMSPQYRFVNSQETDIVKLQSTGEINNNGYIEKIGKDNNLIFGSEYDSGGGGIATTVAEYSKFAAALANGGIGENGEKIISSRTIDLMRQNQLNEQQMQTFTWPQHKGYGYGLGVRTLMSKAESGSNGNLKEFGWGGAAGATIIVDADEGLSMFYAHHMHNPQEQYYQPRIRNVMYSCLD